MATETPTAPVTPGSAPPVARAELARILALYAIASTLYALLGRRQLMPLITPDELTYGHLARSLADGQGFTWRGEGVPLRSALYVYAITPAWLVDSTVTAYAITKLLGALMLSAIVFPVWLLARRFTEPPLALGIAGLVAAGSWMTTSAFVVTENLAFPLSTCCLAAGVLALMRPGSRWGWVALALAVLSAWARFQLLVLLPILLLAFVIDCARMGPGWRERARLHQPFLIAFAAGIVLLGVVALVDADLVAGVYGGAVHFRPSVGATLSAIGKSWIGLFAMAGFIPLVVVASLALTRRAWRDDLAGPLLAVLVPAIILFVGVSGWSSAGFKITWHVQRYVEYVLPLTFLVLAVAARRPGLVPRHTWVVALVLGVSSLLGPSANPGGGRAYYAVARLGDTLVGASASVSCAIAALVVGLLGTAILRDSVARRASAVLARVPAATAVLALTFVVVAAQAAHAWSWQAMRAHDSRKDFPGDLRAVDLAAGGPIARLIITKSHPRFRMVDFFNRDITQMFVPPGPVENGVPLPGKRCIWTVAPTGQMTVEPGCGALPRRYYIDDPSAILTFAGQTLERRLPGSGRIVSVPGAPRVQTIAVTPCDDRTLLRPDGTTAAPRACRSVLSVLSWLDAPATLVVGVRGGREPHTATTGSRTVVLPPGRVTRIRIPVAAGQTQTSLQFDAQEPPLGLPDVVTAVLVRAGHAASIL